MTDTSIEWFGGGYGMGSVSGAAHSVDCCRRWSDSNAGTVGVCSIPTHVVILILMMVMVMMTRDHDVHTAVIEGNGGCL